MLVQCLPNDSPALLIPRFRRVAETVRSVRILESRGDLMRAVARCGNCHVQEKLGFCSEDVEVLGRLGK